MTKLTFQGMASVRNFVPFMSGAKNAHKSPFELAGFETYGLSWIQTMNTHNALFTPTAFYLFNKKPTLLDLCANFMVDLTV